MDRIRSSIGNSCCSGISQRWVFAFMNSLGLCIGDALRSVLPITITQMVPPVNESTQPIDDTCPNLIRPIHKNVTYVSDIVYDWDEYTQGIILSSLYWGYSITQFPYGTLSERFGGKYFFGLGILIPSILTFLTPLAITWGDYKALIVICALMGTTGSTMWPATSALISQWTAPNERALFVSIIFSGALLGVIFGTTVPALIMRYTGMGWQAVFYFFGIVGMIWFPFWTLLVYNNPEDHPFILESEKNFLQESLKEQKHKKPPPAPWRSILTSKRFWAFVAALYGSDWIYFTIASDLPKYMNSVLKFSIEDNGYLSSLPYLCMWCFSIVSSWISNRILGYKLMSLTNVRKFLTTVSLMGPALFIISASYGKCNQALVVALFVFGMMFMGSSYPSIMVNPLDLSPNYAGTIMAIGNGISTTGGILVPYIIGILTPNQTLSEWRFVFWIVFGVGLLTNLIFILFASAEVQDWNDPDFAKDEKVTLTKKPEEKIVGDNTDL